MTEMIVEKESFDELFEAPENIRDAYRKVLPYYEDQSKERLNSIKKRIDFVLKEQGITFGESRTTGYIERPWYLDIIPHIISDEEFQKIERGIKQRITALNLFLNDIYSEQKILRDKVIPIQLIYGDKNYLRDCVNVQVPHSNYLHLGAFDLLRDPDGNYRLLDDNLSIPSGVSYALVNRQIMRQQFPSLFNQLQVRQIWDTTTIILNKLKECSPRNIENPNVVLLSPGIYNEAYSEHELLASRMGIPLVLPKDLIVKENFVYMKTVLGLSRVDVIYRRVQDNYIDPVTFYEGSILGVPGLFSCVRHGNITVANAIGCGIVSSKALLYYSDKIIKYYLSENPLLEVVETLLLTNPSVREYVFERIENYVIKPVQGTGGYGIIIGRESTIKEVNEIKEKVKARPDQYIAQPFIPLSKSKVITAEGLQDRYIETRFFSFHGSTFSLSNCALTRVSPSEKTSIVTNSRGGGSKDTWILGKSERVASHFVLTHGKDKTRRFILSRVAESLFWLGRYVNRALQTANVLKVVYSSEIDILLGSEQYSYNSLVRSISRLTGAPLKRILKKSEQSTWYVRFFEYTVWDQNNPYSMKANLNYAFNNAREIQNMLSADMWVSLNKLLEYIGNTPGQDGESISMDDLSEWLSKVAHYAQSFYGAALDNFSRQDTSQFIQLGRNIEHCNSIVQILKSSLQFLIRVVPNSENTYHLQPLIIIILKFLNSYEAYQWNYESKFDPYLAYRMIVMDRDFNNSLVSSLENIKNTLLTLNPDRTYDDNSPENICDMLISRAYSFDLKAHLGSPEVKRAMVTRGRKFFESKNEVTPGFWANDLKAGVELLGNKIMDRYSNLTSPTPFTMVE
jgi:uncharacterized circularly permuted ATP-grasp superfamily protein/uncharacterized alpha-E superfamily protein